MRSAVWVPLFDALSDPLAVARLAARAEEVGWHGFFVWDHVNWRPPITSVADPWITLAAIATATEALTLGPMVTPLARRRPVKVARETATLDRLSGGRLVLGAGLGDDRFGYEFSKTGDELDGRVRGEMLDEALAILPTAWSGRPVPPWHALPRRRHHLPPTISSANHSHLDRGLSRQRGAPASRGTLSRLLPRQPRFTRASGRRRGCVADLRENHTPTEPFDIAVACAPSADVAAYAEAGATWWLTDFEPEALRSAHSWRHRRRPPALTVHATYVTW